MKKWFIGISVFFTGFFSWHTLLFADASLSSPLWGKGRIELRQTAAFFEKGSTELSGIAFSERGGFFIVADDLEDHFIYYINPAQFKKNLGEIVTTKNLELRKQIDLTKLKGFKTYEQQMLGQEVIPKKDRRLDLEGIATCGDKDIYLANERVRQVLHVSQENSLELLPVDFDSLPGAGDWFYAGGSNAGFEGIAIDCQKRLLYLAKERDPRKLIVVDLATNKAKLLPDPPVSDRAGQKVIDVFSGNGLMDIGPDIADLFFANGKLYLLERNTHEILKIDATTGAAEARVSYLRSEQGLYETGEPFGSAEILLLTPDTIIVGFDNNRAPLSLKAQKLYEFKSSPSANHGALFYFERPKGF
jgi:hypothetical protein